MRKMYFIFSLCLAMFFTIFLSSALAASEYDNDVTLANYLRLGAPGPNGGESCTQGTRDVSLDWSSVLLEEVDHSVVWYEHDHYPGFISDFESNLESGSGWFVQQVTDGLNPAGGLEVRVGIFEPTSEIYFNSSHFLAGFEYGRMLTMYIHSYSSNCRIVLEMVNYTNVEHFDYVNPKNLFLIATNNITYPAGYEGEEIPSAYTPPEAAYVAMGDSFSSGEGNPPFETGAEEECHRSLQAYPRLLQGDAYLDLGGPTAFVACSGVTTSSMSSQMSALSGETKVVTITIGGNDVGFKELAEECFWNICDSESTAFTHSQEELGILPIRLLGFESEPKGVLDVIHEKAPSAHVYVIGYPQIVPSVMPEECSSINTQAEYEAMRGITTELNEVIKNATQSAVSRYGSEHFTFVDPTAEGSPFIGREYCTLFPLFNEPDPLHPVYSFHPNEEGQQAYKEIVKDYLNE